MGFRFAGELCCRGIWNREVWDAAVIVGSLAATIIITTRTKATARPALDEPLSGAGHDCSLAVAPELSQLVWCETGLLAAMSSD
jgi:hypothetical protein